MNSVLKGLCTVAVAATAGFVGIPSTGANNDQASAQIVTDAKRRVNIAGRQRMLTQRMTKAVCMTALGVKPEMHREMMRSAHADFAKALAGLRHGDDSLGLLLEETHSRVLVGLESVEQQWETFDAKMTSVIDTGDFAPANTDVIFNDNLPLLKKMNDTVALIEQAYANPNEMLLGNAVAINIAGRQRMLTQRMGKEFCLINLGWNADKQKEALTATIGLFEASHDALLNGAPAYGIIPPPTDQIRDDLQELGDRWQALRGMVVRAIEGGSLSAGELEHFAEQNDQMLKEMHAIVGLYEKS